MSPLVSTIDSAANVESPVDETPRDPHAPANPDFCEEVAQQLGEPLPADWRDPVAVAGRQDTLRAIAAITGDAALELALETVLARERGESLTLDHPAMVRMLDELAALFQGLRAYVGSTQSGDGRAIIMEALEEMFGAHIAAFVDGLFERPFIEEFPKA